MDSDFKIGDAVIITCPPGSIVESYNGLIKEVIAIDDMGWVKVSSEDEFKWKWLPPGYVRHYKPEHDELIEPADLSDIML